MAMRYAAASIVLALSVGLCLHPAGAYPGYWANIAKTDCTRVPASSKDLSSSPHQPPQLNSGLKFELRTSTGSLVNSLCPGGSYKLKLLFPVGDVHYLLVSTHGNFSEDSVCGKVDGCPNRACNCAVNRADSESSLSKLCPVVGKEVEHTLVMPADDALKGATNIFQAVYIADTFGGLGTLQTNTASLNFTCSPSLTNSVNATSLQVNQVSTLRIRVFNGPTGVKLGTVTSTPAGILSCTPTKPRFNAKNTATVNCKAQKVGVATVVVTFAGAKTTRVLRVR